MNTLQQYALEYLAVNEGGFVNHPSDPGGATNYGISLRWLRSQGPIVGDLDGDGDVDIDDIRAMSKQQADALYLQHFWKPEYDRLAAEIAVRVFDHNVNAGERSSGLILQRACRAHGGSLKEDGVIGRHTVMVANQFGATLLPALRAERAGFYRSLVARNSKFEDFEKGWLTRAYK